MNLGYFFLLFKPKWQKVTVVATLQVFVRGHGEPRSGWGEAEEEVLCNRYTCFWPDLGDRLKCTDCTEAILALFLFS